MVEPVTGHPAADRATAEAFVVEQFRTVVPASTWLVDAARAAGRGGRVLQLLTDERGELTYPLELLLRDSRAQWVVREDSGRHRDGIHGIPLSWDGTRFTPDLDTAPSFPAEPTPGAGDLEVQIATSHPTTGPLLFGESAEAAMRALTGAEPLGWGVAEPATEPWSIRDITEHCRRRAPQPTKLVIVGPGVAGQLSVSFVDTEVVEELRLSGVAAGTVPQDSIEALAAVSAATARLMVVAAHTGRLNGRRSSAPAPPGLPYGVLIGHEMVAAYGVPHARRAPATRVKIVSAGRRDAVWCRFDGGRRAPFEQLADVLHHYGAPAQD